VYGEANLRERKNTTEQAENFEDTLKEDSAELDSVILQLILTHGGPCRFYAQTTLRRPCAQEGRVDDDLSGQ